MQGARLVPVPARERKRRHLLYPLHDAPEDQRAVDLYAEPDLQRVRDHAEPVFWAGTGGLSPFGGAKSPPGPVGTAVPRGPEGLGKILGLSAVQRQLTASPGGEAVFLSLAPPL